MAFGIRFDEGKKWYRVPEVIIRFNEENKADEEINMVDYLRQVRNDNDDAESPLAFDVCSKGEALKMDEDEKRAVEVAAAKADNPHPVDLVAVEQRYHTPKVMPVVPKRGPGRPPKAKPPVPVKPGLKV